LLFVGRFGAGGSEQLVEAAYDGGKLQLLRSRTELSARIPAIARRFPKNDDYANAAMDKILGADQLAAAERYEATELRSGVFLSQPDGAYRFEPLPQIAQISPLQGIVTGDFDADGHVDIYAVQNSFAPVPAVGPFDGGVSQLLKGDGRGGFTSAPARESGLVVSGDAKAVVVLDLDRDGWPDFLVSRNNDTTLAWRNRGVTGARSFRVILQGPAGNERAIGARVVCELASGTRQTYELQAGGGYYSHSAPGCFFGYSERNPPRRLMVRWPGGRETEHGLPALPPASLTLSAP
jgi:hypothetical protein